MGENELRRAARASGMRPSALPSLEQVEKRRFELWLVSSVLLVGITAGITVLSLWSPQDLHNLLVRPYFRYGLLGISTVMCAYSIEKERSLRKVSQLLVGERMLTTALSNRLHEIGTLLDAGRAVNSTLELDRVLASILAGATELLPASSGSVMLVEDGTLVVSAVSGTAGPLGSRCSLGEGIAGKVARTRVPLLVNGSATAEEFPGLAERSAGHDRSVRSALCVPLIERDELVGVINLSADAEDQFTEYDLRAVSLFAEQASAAVSKARLYEQSRRQAEQLEYAATHDPLTGLANRAALAERASSTGSRSLLFLDLDGFKDINDALGHRTGDAVLVATAERLVSSVSSRDLVSRFGGDEFAILLESVVEPVVAAAIGGRLLDLLNAPMVVCGHRVRVSASIGVAVCDPDTADLDTLLQRADRALYAAKDEGKARLRVYETAGDVVTAPRGPAGGLPQPRVAELEPRAAVGPMP